MSDLDMLLQDQTTTEGTLSLRAVPSREKDPELLREGRLQSRRRPRPLAPSSRRQVNRYSGSKGHLPGRKRE